MSFEEDAYDSIFYALKHSTRRKVLRLLEDAPMTYTEILNQLNMKTGVLNYHLNVLKQLLLKTEENRYSLSDLGKAAINLMLDLEGASEGDS